MISLTLSETGRAALASYGVPLDEAMFWWGALASLQRADDAYSILSPERRSRLNVLIRTGNESPGSLTKRDKAFYIGLLAEVAAVLDEEPRI